MKKVVIRDCTVYHGDCLEMLDEIPPGSVHVAVTDPPFGCKFVPNSRKVLAIPNMLANDERPHLEFVEPIVKTIKPGGAVYLCTRFDVMQLWADALKIAGANVKSHLVWDKLTGSQGDLLGAYSNRVEIILFAHVGRHLLRNGRPDNLWAIPRPAPQEHPTPKPVELFRRCIVNSSSPGETVLDPFLGTGTTAVACVLTGRKFIGSELNARYFDISCERIEAAYKDVDSRLPGFEPVALEQGSLFD